MKKLLLVFLLSISANAKWVMFSGQSSNGEQSVFIYNDETGEVFSKFPTGGFIRESFGDFVKIVELNGKEMAVIDKVRDKPKK